MKQTEKRCYDGQEFRALANDNEKYIEGHAAVFEQKTNICDWFYEVIERGAFDEIEFKDVALFVNHNWESIPLARSRRNNGNSTMTLKVDDVGLAIRAKLDVERNSAAENLYSAIERGDLNGMSFCFSVDAEEWQDLKSNMPTRRIKKIGQVFEVSACNYPAYEQTDINTRAKQFLLNKKRSYVT